MPRKPSQWVSTSHLAQALGVSAKWLLKVRGANFKEGVHWRNISKRAWRPTYRWNLKAVETLLNTSDDQN